MIYDKHVNLRIGDYRFEGNVGFDSEKDTFSFEGLSASGDAPLEEILSKDYYWKHSNGESVYLGHTYRELLENSVRHSAGIEGYAICNGSHQFFKKEELKEYEGLLYHKALFRFSEFAEESVPLPCGGEATVRRASGALETLFVPDSWASRAYYCCDCGAYIEDASDYAGHDRCRWCEADYHERNPIEGYTESHRHNDDPVLFGEYKDKESFAGLGFELEVDTEDDEDLDNNETARKLCSESGLEENEMRFADDGSLRYGFECISEPHTVKDFWTKTKKWVRMLEYLRDCGYRSHDPGTCGLHVHVSRTMFGKTEAEQDAAIAKVYWFFDKNWPALLRASRRTDTEYCDRVSLDDSYEDTEKAEYKKWKDKAKRPSAYSHHRALNNNNKHTFEYRLGRGTLNTWSFFAWIDLVLTITKNARRITINKVSTNDLVSWLGGIREETARYLYKKGAFACTVLELYPAIAWSSDSAEC